MRTLAMLTPSKRRIKAWIVLDKKGKMVVAHQEKDNYSDLWIGSGRSVLREDATIIPCFISYSINTKKK